MPVSRRPRKKPNPGHKAERCDAARRLVFVAIFRISVIDRAFRACGDHEFASFDAARKEGLKAALAIGSEEVANGAAYFAAEIRVEAGEGLLGRFAVSVGASPLQ